MSEDGGARLLFDDGESAFGDAMAPPLAELLKDLKADDRRRVQLLAYAASAGGNASKARRLSLSRALSVRAYLMAQGIASTRMDVRALGDQKNSGGPADRVDLKVLVPR
jgi:outer membrane protein OmpA-like peptidoglycan-associated protein